MNPEHPDHAELLQAVLADDGDRVRAVIAQHPGSSSARGTDGVSLIMTAVYRRRAAALEALLADQPALDLFEAAALGRVERLGALLDGGADLEARSADGFTALHLASYFGQGRAVESLLHRGANVNAVASNPMRLMALHSAASAASPTVVRLLLEHGAEANARQQGGFTPIHASAQNGDLESIELLLARGADPALQSDDGKSAIDHARSAGRSAAEERLSRA